MNSRSEMLRRRDRKVFGWALAVAVALHVAVFVLFPGFRFRVFHAGEVELGSGSRSGSPAVSVEVVFGAPTITDHAGVEWPEPPEHILEAGRVVPVPGECASAIGRTRLPVTGSVRLIVGGSGRASVAHMVQSMGEPCADEIMKVVAEALRYLWLPSERFPNPVDLVQPVTLTSVE